MTPTKDQIFAANDSPTEKVPVPEWGEGAEVYVRIMSGTERDAWEVDQYRLNTASPEVNLKNLRARVLVRCVVNDTGQNIFDEGDAEKLGGKSSKVIDRLYAVARRLNGLTKADVDELI